MNDIKIGKNAIENLTIGMYEDSKIIYREYIQNATDQIKRAMQNNLFNEKLFVDISIDTKKRVVTITDNATGIPRNQVKSKLADVADSDKDQFVDAGFRGIGRLGGLAYCDKLKFITSYKGEKVKTIMTWDAEKLIKMLNDRDVKDDASTVLEKVISYDYEECPEDNHFFTVELQNIRQENVELLDVEKVRQYISMNAPVPYDSKLIFKSKIYDYLESKSLPKNEYTIYVNKEDIIKPYTTTLYENSSGQKKKYDDIFDIKIEEFKNEKGELLAWMWYGISSFIKCIPLSVNPMAGIRIRQSNIQIGDGDTLTPLSKDHRDNYYFIGEVHVVHPGIKPNARRDYFNESIFRNELEVQLKYYLRNVCRPLFYNASKVNCFYRKCIELRIKEQAYKNKDGKFVNDKEKQNMEKGIENAKKENEKEKKQIERLKAKAEYDNNLKKVIENVEKNYHKKLVDKKNNLASNINVHKSNSKSNVKHKIRENKQKNNKYGTKKSSFLVDELSKLNDRQRKLVSKIYGVIKENLPNEESDDLINKIQEELKK